MELKNKKIAFIGTGRLAHSLAAHLQKNGFTISAILSSRMENADKFGAEYKIPIYQLFNGEIPNDCDVVFITASDQHIESISKKFASSNKKLKGKTFVHFSGSLNSTALKILQKKKAVTASFHIMQTFPSKKIVSIKDCYAAVETSDETLLFSLFNFAKQLKLKPFRINPENKIFYHLAGVFTSNFLLSHFYNAQHVYKSAGIERLGYLNLYGNIIDETIRNIKFKGVEESISGPAGRGDIVTIKNHITLLENKKEFLLLVNYITESLTILDLADKYLENKKDFAALRKYLNQKLKDSVKKIK